MTVAALYVDAKGPYAGMRGVDAWPIERDATKYDGPYPVVAHPPCAAWSVTWGWRGNRRRPGDATGRRAVEQVCRFGGVLEQPAHSRLWSACLLARAGGGPDLWGGRTIQINQSEWGHRADKPTWLYIVGCGELEDAPYPGRRGECRVEDLWSGVRHLTPRALAAALVRLAEGCGGER